MTVRSLFLSLALAALGSTSSLGQAVWTGATSSLISNPLNWTGGNPNGADLVFSTTIRPLVEVDASLAANSLTFSGLYPAYSFSTANASSLTIGAGGLSVAAQADIPIDFAAPLSVKLSTSQTWKVDGVLGVEGPISSTSGATTLTKTGTGTLTLGGASTFNGGIVLQQGTLLINTGSIGAGGTITSGSLGLGGLTVSTDSTFGAAKSGLVLQNPITLATDATLVSGSNEDGLSGLTLSGAVTASSTDMLVKLTGSNPLTFAGSLDGPANTALRFQSTSTAQLDAAAFTGTTSANIVSLTADHTALFFISATSVTTTVGLQAINEGYIGVAATGSLPHLPASAVLSRITDPKSFAGTFGFDTLPNAGAPEVYNEDLDFSAFTHSSFRIGTATEAVLSGIIAPPLTGNSTAYRFGSGGGHLFVQSNLDDAFDSKTQASVPTSVIVSSPTGDDLSSIILGGLNTFTGTTRVRQVTSNLRVDRAIVILDSQGALPAEATFSMGADSYVGATEAAGFTSFADFLSHVAANGYDANSVFGVDSHAFIQEKMAKGDQQKTNAVRVISSPVDLSSLTAGFLGTATRVRIAGEVRAPSNGILQLTGVSEGRLSITSNLTPTTIGGSANVTSVVIGYPTDGNAREFGESEVELTGASTYTGGTKLQSGALIVGNNSTVNAGTLVSGPIGTGTLTVAPASDPVILASNSFTGATLHNPIVVSGPLQLGNVNPSQESSSSSAFDPNKLVLAGNISGTGSIAVHGRAVLSGTNTYAGGTHAQSGSLIFASASSIPAVDSLTSSVEGYMGLAEAPLLPLLLQTGFINRFDPANTHGTIGFDSLTSTATVFSDPISMIGFTNPTTRLGSASLAKLTGTITPAETVYRFGGGGGYLEVASALTGNTQSVEASSPQGSSLTLRLTGANTYQGETEVSNSAVIFGAGALPAVSAFLMDSNGYIGTEDAALDANFGSFLGHFAPTLDRGTIGFDSAPGSSGRTINSALNLGYFTGATPNFFIGTSTNLTFGPAASITLPVNATAYRFAAYKGGRLQIDTVLTGSKGLVIGDPTSLMSQVSPAGTASSVVLNAANTFSGGTTLYAGNLYLGTSTVGTPILSGPIGTGTLTVDPIQFSNGILRPVLRPLNTPVMLANAIVLNSDLGAAGDLTLAGSISGNGGIYKVDSGNLNLSGSNSSWGGGIFINEGTVTFTQNASAGTGMLRLGGLVASTATFTSTAPMIGSLAGENSGDQLVLATNSILNISQAGSTRYLGQISGSGSSVVIQGLDPNVVNSLTLGGANLYTGGTTIGANTKVIAAHSGALGTSGTVTLNQGSLAVNQGITTTFSTAHPLVINGGTLGGTGTFAFDTSLNVKGGANGTVVLSPGFNQPGKLNFNFTTGATLVLDAGGNYHWKLMDASNSAGGWDTISVAGGVNINATALAPFDLKISTVAADGSSGEAGNFNVYSSYSWTLLTATSITGFDPTNFNLDTTMFLNRTLDGTFSVSLDGAGTSLLLNYTAAAIPEPSTWAMMIIGVVVIAYSSLRRRRS